MFIFMVVCFFTSGGGLYCAYGNHPQHFTKIRVATEENAERMQLAQETRRPMPPALALYKKEVAVPKKKAVADRMAKARKALNALCA